VSTQERVAVVTAPYDVDVHNSAHLKNDLHEAFRMKPPVIVLNFSETIYLDSSGLGVVIGFHRRLIDTSTRFVLVLMPHSYVARLLERTGCDKYFTIESSMEKASKPSFSN